MLMYSYSISDEKVLECFYIIFVIKKKFIFIWGGGALLRAPLLMIR